MVYGVLVECVIYIQMYDPLGFIAFEHVIVNTFVVVLRMRMSCTFFIFARDQMLEKSVLNKSNGRIKKRYAF